MVDTPPTPAASEAFSLEDLLAVAGERLGEEISPRTVRLYATQGLIDRPGRQGRSAVYGRRHLLQLLLIRALARRGLSLSAIAPLIALADGELEQQLQQLESPDPGDCSQPPQGPATGEAQLASEREEAIDYLLSLDTPEADKTQRSASLLSMLGTPLARMRASTSLSRSPGRSGSSREATSRWHRFSLAPGVELQISESVAIPPSGPRRRAWLQRLADRLIAQLHDSPL